MLGGKQHVENLYFAVVCVSIFTCLVRSDYNFAIGLLCYYMVKNAGDKLERVSTTVSAAQLIKFKFRFRGR